MNVSSRLCFLVLRKRFKRGKLCDGLKNVGVMTGARLGTATKTLLSITR